MKAVKIVSEGEARISLVFDLKVTSRIATVLPWSIVLQAHGSGLRQFKCRHQSVVEWFDMVVYGESLYSLDPFI